MSIYIDDSMIETKTLNDVWQEELYQEDDQNAKYLGFKGAEDPAYHSYMAEIEAFHSDSCYEQEF